jgi:hypothetical protein
VNLVIDMVPAFCIIAYAVMTHFLTKKRLALTARIAAYELLEVLFDIDEQTLLVPKSGALSAATYLIATEHIADAIHQRSSLFWQMSKNGRAWTRQVRAASKAHEKKEEQDGKG